MKTVEMPRTFGRFLVIAVTSEAWISFSSATIPYSAAKNIFFFKWVQLAVLHRPTYIKISN